MKGCAVKLKVSVCIVIEKPSFRCYSRPVSWTFTALLHIGDASYRALVTGHMPPRLPIKMLNFSGHFKKAV